VITNYTTEPIVEGVLSKTISIAMYNGEVRKSNRKSANNPAA
jgi:hypothetical protein